jgi:hypothetical protein
MSGILYHSPAEIIAQLMVDLGLADFEDPDLEPLTGWTVFPLHLPESPDQAIQVKDTHGRLHRRAHVTGIMGEHYGLQLLARSAQDPATPYLKMKAILHFFDTEVNRELVTLEDSDGVEQTYRVNAITRTSMPLPAGKDGGRFFYSGNVIASIEFVESEDTGTGT